MSKQNKKANQRLDILTEIFADAAGDRTKDIEKGFLQKKMHLEGFRYLNELDLNYNYENRMFTVTYTLELKARIETDERFSETGSAKFAIQRGSGQKRKDVFWVSESFGGSASEKERYLERLNHPLILDRIRDLELFDVFAEHKKDSGCWTILADSLIGSTTWLLLPPATNLIKPSKPECIKMYELFELIADATVNNRTDS